MLQSTGVWSPRPGHPTGADRRLVTWLRTGRASASGPLWGRLQEESGPLSPRPCAALTGVPPSALPAAQAAAGRSRERDTGSWADAASGVRCSGPPGTPTRPSRRPGRPGKGLRGAPLIGRESFWQPRGSAADPPFPLAFTVTAGGWPGIIYEAGGESAPKGATGHGGPCSARLSQAGDNEGGGRCCPPPNSFLSFTPPLHPPPNVALCLRISGSTASRPASRRVPGPEPKEGHIPRTSWKSEWLLQPRAFTHSALQTPAPAPAQ